MKALVLVVAAILLFGCIQTTAPAATPDNTSASVKATGVPSPTMEQYRAKMSGFFEQPGKIAYRTRFEYVSNGSEEEDAFIELFKALISGQESDLAWKTDHWRLQSSVGLFGGTLNETTYVSANGSFNCIDDEPCEPIEPKWAVEKINTAKKALIDAYEGISLPEFLETQKAFLPSYKGLDWQAGRPCARFELAVNHTYVNQTFYTRAASGQLNSLKEAKTQFLIRGIQKPIALCLDDEKGYVALVRIEVDLSQAYSKEEVPFPIRMILIQEVTEFKNNVQEVEFEPADTAKAQGNPVNRKPDALPDRVNVLPLNVNSTSSDGTRYAYVGKQNGSYLINIENIKNASCARMQLKLPEWMMYECNGTAELFYLYEDASDEFQVAFEQQVFKMQAYDPANRPLYALPEGMPVPFPDVPLIMQYDGKTAQGHRVLVGPWQGPCPTETFYLNDETITYACDGQTYVIKSQNAFSDSDGLTVQVIKK